MSDGGVKFQVEQRDLTKAVIIHPVMQSPAKGEQATGRAQIPSRAPQDMLDEAVRLASAIELEIVHAGLVQVAKPKPSSLFGAGKVEELAGLIASVGADVTIVNGTLSPVQQRNLERAWVCKVLDRTGLILEIFGRRAKTREGRLQVELAHLNYQKSRLVRSWTHLERQRGGLGFVGGPGETQIEADRRLIQERVVKLEKQLDKVRRTRRLHRAARKKVPYPVIALVGYTNAGKSTLFNLMTKAKVDARDQLFATLDPTMRAIELDAGRHAILSDTVGFISQLPTTLVAAFRATLEEVLEADVIVHVRDIADPRTDAQLADVQTVLAELEIDEQRRAGVIEVWNKIDLLDADRRREVLAQAARSPHAVAASSKTGEGLDRLKTLLRDRIAILGQPLRVMIDSGQGADIHWLYEHCQVDFRRDHDNGKSEFHVRVPEQAQGKFGQLFDDIHALQKAAE
jgi:GTP-binding protein HflX